MSAARSLSLSLLVGLVLGVGGCDLTSPETEAADVRGLWEFTGTQLAPDVDLAGTFDITAQDGQSIAGIASWEESGAPGGIVVRGGPIAGRAIGETDVDFDVTLESGVRRFLGRLSVDTIAGAWVQSSTGGSGTFRAVRTSR